jgi:transmembrane sensor
MKLNPSKASRAEAAEWLVTFREGPGSEEDRRRFVDWLQESPLHVAEYLELACIWQDVGAAADSLELPPVFADDSTVVPLIRERDLEERPQRTGTRVGGRARLGVWWVGLAVASVLVAVGLLRWALPAIGPLEYQTAIGEQRSLPLEDGSIVSLNTGSKVRVDLRAAVRRVELLAGEALFDVAPDPDRPFIVTVRDTEIRAVGTSFNVYRQADKVAVTVLEGRVALTSRGPPASAPAARSPGASAEGPRAARSIELGSGQQAYVDRASAAITAEPVDTERVIAWTERRLIFDNARLADVVAEFNRYNTGKLEVRDPELAGLRLSGVFQAHDPASLIEFLQISRSIRVLPTGANQQLLTRQSGR